MECVDWSSSVPHFTIVIQELLDFFTLNWRSHKIQHSINTTKFSLTVSGTISCSPRYSHHLQNFFFFFFYLKLIVRNTFYTATQCTSIRNTHAHTQKSKQNFQETMFTLYVIHFIIFILFYFISILVKNSDCGLLN